MQNLRLHYARPCRLWVEHLLAHEQARRSIVGGAIYRTWVPYLAASALSFETGLTDIHQVLLAKRSNPGTRHWTRAYLYT